MKHMFSNGLRVFRERISRPRPPSWDPLAAYSSASSSIESLEVTSVPPVGNGSSLVPPTSSHGHPRKLSRNALRLDGRLLMFL